MEGFVKASFNFLKASFCFPCPIEGIGCSQLMQRVCDCSKGGYKVPVVLYEQSEESCDLLGFSGSGNLRTGYARATARVMCAQYTSIRLVSHMITITAI